MLRGVRVNESKFTLGIGFAVGCQVLLWGLLLHLNPYQEVQNAHFFILMMPLALFFFVIGFAFEKTKQGLVAALVTYGILVLFYVT